MCEKHDLIHCQVSNLRSWAQINVLDVAPVPVKWFLILIYRVNYLVYDRTIGGIQATFGESDLT